MLALPAVAEIPASDAFSRCPELESGARHDAADPDCVLGAAAAQTVVGPSLTAAAGVEPHEIGTLAALCSFGAVWFLMGGLRLMSDLGPCACSRWALSSPPRDCCSASPRTGRRHCSQACWLASATDQRRLRATSFSMQTAPAQHRALIFSIKQAGAPFGSALAGLVLPHVAESFGWRAALVVAAGAALACAVVVEPYRAGLDRQRARISREALIALVSPRMVLAPFHAIAGLPILQRLGFADACSRSCRAASSRSSSRFW